MYRFRPIDLSPQVSILPFEAWHLWAMEQREESIRAGWGPRWREQTLDVYLQCDGVGASLLSDRVPLAVGLVMKSPAGGPGDGIAAMHSGIGFERWADEWTWDARTRIPKMAEALGIRRLYATVIEAWEAGREWLEFLGFRPLYSCPDPTDITRTLVLYVRECHGHA
jgi:hypothetical protein